jgi:hypothetical protein
MKSSGREGKRVEKPRSSTIDSELGRLAVDRYELKQGVQKVFDTALAILPETGSREAYKTPCFRELTVFFPCDEPFRKSADKLNRVLWREEGQMVQSRTMANLVEREGGFSPQNQARTGQKHRSTSSKWKGRYLYPDDCHCQPHDDRGVSFSAQ